MTILFLGALLTAALPTAASNEIDDAAYHVIAPRPFSTPRYAMWGCDDVATMMQRFSTRSHR